MRRVDCRRGKSAHLLEGGIVSVKVIRGNIFATRCQTIVNTVNCVGVMGAGIALECRLRWPTMYDKYVKLCRAGHLQVGLLWLYKASDRWILNFPTKQHWKAPSIEEYLHAGLRKFMATYQDKGISSIAFPLLGSQNGGLDQAVSRQIMEGYLNSCTIPVELYLYDPRADDELMKFVREMFLAMTPTGVKARLKCSENAAQIIWGAMKDPSICQINQLARIDGIGIKTVEKIFALVRSHRGSEGAEVVAGQGGVGKMMI